MLAPLPGLCLSEKGREPSFTGSESTASGVQLVLSGEAHTFGDGAFGSKLAFASAFASVDDGRHLHVMFLMWVVMQISMLRLSGYTFQLLGCFGCGSVYRSFQAWLTCESRGYPSFDCKLEGIVEGLLGGF